MKTFWGNIGLSVTDSKELDCFYKKTTAGLFFNVLVILFSLVFAPSLFASDISLAWLANSEPDLAGYKLSYGTSTKNYSSNIDVGSLQPDLNNEVSYLLTGLTPGFTYYFAVSAYDQSGNESGYSNEVSHVLSLQNSSPVANAGADRSLSPGSVTLDGTASSDPDGDTLTYRWRQVSGNAVILSNPSSVTPSFSATSGTFTFELIVNDGSIDSAADTVLITVAEIPVNSAPVANAGADQSLPPGSVTLDGTSSSDPDGDTLTYSWNQISGSTVSLADVFSPTPSFFATRGTFTFELTVSDSQQTSSDQVKIKINNIAPTADAGPDKTHGRNRLVTLDGTRSSDSNNDSLSYSWTLIDGSSVSLANADSANPTFTPEFSGVYVFGLIVSDATLQSSQDTVNIIINDPNSVPSALALDQTGIVGNEIMLDGSGSSDADNDSLSYSWTFISGPSYISLANPTSSSPSFTPSEPGIYKFSLTVSDGIDTSIPSAATVSVNDPNNNYYVPVADAGSDIIVYLGDLVTLGGGKSSGSGDLTFSWTQITGPNVTLSDTTSMTPGFTAPLSGLYVFEMTVNDGRNTSLPDTVVVSVLGANNPPVANAGSDQLIIAGNDVFLDGSKSSDPDADSLTYSWTQAGNGAPNVTLIYSDTDHAKFYASVPYRYVFELIVFDGINYSTPDTVSISVNLSDNKVPEAFVEYDSIVETGSTVILNASSSIDEDNDPLIFRWRQLSGPTVILENQDAQMNSFIPAREGEYVFEFTVNDGVIGGDPVIININVIDKILSNQVVKAATGVSLTAAGGGISMIELNIPTGAIESDKAIAIGESNLLLPDPGDNELISSVINIQPDNLKLNLPVEITFTIGSAYNDDEIIIKIYNDSTNAWTDVPVSSRGDGTVSIKTSSLGRFVIEVEVAIEPVTQTTALAPVRSSGGGGGCGFIKPVDGSGPGGGAGFMMMMSLAMVASLLRRQFARWCSI